jgi:antitoxin YefM
VGGLPNNAVLLSSEDWSAIQETLYLLAISGMRESIKTDMAEPLAKSAREIIW